MDQVIEFVFKSAEIDDIIIDDGDDDGDGEDNLMKQDDEDAK